MIDSDRRPVSNRHPLTSLSQITVRFKGILKSASFSKFSDLWPIYRYQIDVLFKFVHHLHHCILYF